MRKFAIPVKEKPVLCIQKLILKKTNLQISRPLYCISNFFSFVIFMEGLSLVFVGFSLLGYGTVCLPRTLLSKGMSFSQEVSV